MHCKILSLINPAVYLLYKFFVGLSDRRCMPKCDFFFLIKRMKETFAYVLEFMLTFDKMQNTNTLMSTKFEI